MNWRLSAGVALLALAVMAATVIPVFGQGRGPFGGRPGMRGGSGMPGGEGRGPFGGDRGGPAMMIRGGSGMPGGEGRGPVGGDGGGPGVMMRGGSRGFSSGESSAERFANALRAMDTDHDGRVEENEVEGRRRFFVEMMARRAGIEPKFPISVSKLEKTMAKRSKEAGENSSSEKSEKSKSKQAAADPLVPGFGVEMDLPPLLNFGERAEAASSNQPKAPSRSSSRNSSSSSRTSSSRESSSSRRSSSQGEDDRYRRMAEVMMRQYDRNHNQRLERDEWNDRWGEFSKADRNHDGVVKLEEMTQRLGDYSRSRSRSGGSSGSSSSGTNRSKDGSDNSDQGKSYRFRTAIERLPEGLPDWFVQKDANADGQVAMAEFESPGSWTSATAAQFVRYDLNNDGVVTPAECLEVMQQPESDSEVVKTNVASQVARTSPGISPGSGSTVSSKRGSSSSSTGSSTSGGAWDGF